MNNETYRANWALRIAAVLLCLVLISTYMMSGLMAKYVSTAESSDGARTAAFNIEETGTLTQSFDFEVTPMTEYEATDSNVQVPYNIVINNNSETAVSYIIKVTNETKNLPIELKLEEVLASNASAADKNAAVAAASAERTGNLVANTGVDEYKLVVEWPNAEDANNFIYHREIDHITVTVECEQID